MKRAFGALCASVLTVSAAMPSAVLADQPSPAEFLQVQAGDAVPGAYIVMLKERPGVSVEEILSRHHLATKFDFERVKGFAARLNAQQLTALRLDPEVALIEPDVIVTAFPSPRQQFDWSKVFPQLRKSSSSSSKASSAAPVLSSSRISSAPPSSVPASSIPASSVPASSAASSRAAVAVPTGVNRIDAELSLTARIDGVDDRVDADIAVLDTGVEAHADLNVFKQVSFVSGEASLTDENGHGTHVAGTAAAKDNGVGVIGVAPGARIWSVKVLNRQGSGMMSDIIAGVDYVASNAAQIDVANMSLGCECASAALDAALSRAVNAGVVFSVAAGNSGKDASTFSPAKHPDVITVSAVTDFDGLPGGLAVPGCYNDKDDTLAPFSNFGSPVDVAAPGVCIRSTWKGGAYNTISGTSMASPHVAGAAALYIAKNGKPTDAAGVAGVRSAIVAAGASQGSPEGFTGDVDAFAEPLLQVDTF